jgi:predicted thioesterase
VAAVDGRRVRFDVEASDGTRVVGKGTHDRFVVDIKRFAARLRKQFG